MVNLPCYSMHNVRRTFFRRSAIGITAATGTWLCWYNKKLELDAAQVNPFDKEIVRQFYEKNPNAQAKLYQQLKEEAQKGDVFWYDVFPHGALRSRGDIDSKLPNNHQSKKTECLFSYNLDTKTNKHYLEHYDCVTRLSRGEIKKCLQESIKEGKIK